MGWSRRLLSVSFATLLLVLPFNEKISATSRDYVIPMGHSIGIQMDLSGVYITNDVLVQEDYWLKAGDSITKMDGIPVVNLKDFEKAVGKAKKGQIHMNINRKGTSIEIQADGDAVKRLLPFLKDRTEGTGTLTYVDPNSGTYGALGHQIVDSSLKSPPSFKKGAIYLSEIEQIKKSIPGTPGYKISSIIDGEDYLGTIKTNGVYGIFGNWNVAYKKVLAEPLEIMQPTELQTGAAEIFTTVKGTEVEKFSIRITQIEEDQFQFVLTDPGLLEATGGILQGMSGSPVIQNGKFVGAITHMFVDEPKKGAGLFLVTMRDGENK
ncbi:SpoIVB peptidase S55 domain-containing protein [Sporosarcina highlanderae]|uniref:SpoIVB peptidase S55 domain-containing protein n=1 Tax=Sporosarcina highlanderae TaxID=3035916 RepID=A0ABT8JTQ3_9BACL|nr:SpoIVB peptidase S55 domain-containing protein [Sporosarcina highlanderae]MDN4607772.1 SpoIVB peptidase S55 domain-containing protein [Sporosarcina highlanderae]